MSTCAWLRDSALCTASYIYRSTPTIFLCVSLKYTYIFLLFIFSSNVMLLQLKLSPLTWGLSAVPPRGSVPHLSPAHRPAAAVKPVMAQDHPQLHPSLIAAQLAGPSISSSVTCALSHSVMCDSATPWTAAHQAHLSMGFSRQEYWSAWPFPTLRNLPRPGMEPMLKE